MMSHITYLDLTILMAMESSVFPVPAELVMTPAGYLVSQGQLALVPTFLLGMLGIALGASFNYCIGRFVGRSLILRYGRYFFIRPDHYLHAEGLFLRDGVYYTFFGRLIPGVRHLISIPAGMARMSYPIFIAATLSGSAIWFSFLLFLGYTFGANIDLIRPYITDFFIVVGVVLCIAAGILYVRHKKGK